MAHVSERPRDHLVSLDVNPPGVANPDARLIADADLAVPSSTFWNPMPDKVLTGGMQVRTILAPTDFSPASFKALERAVSLTNQCGARLTILHVIDINMQIQSGTAKDLMKRLWTEGSARMARLAWSLCGQVEAQTILEEGLPWEKIVEKSCDFDLLILGRSRRERGCKLFSANTHRRVLEFSACPVMVVHDRN